MNFRSLIGRTFDESEFYQILLFDIEENFEQYFSKFIHIYFERSAGGRIKITDCKQFINDVEMDKMDRELVGKIEWYEVYDNFGHIDLMLCKLDRTGEFSTVRKHETRHQKISRIGWLDEFSMGSSLTQEEMRIAFLELSGLLEEDQELSGLRPKKAV